jgi:enterochelin esterase-like enzyme
MLLAHTGIILAYLILPILVVASFIAAAPLAASEIRRQTFYSPALQRDIPVMVYLPDGYQGGSERYPVLYLLHGAACDEQTWIERGNIKDRTDRLIARGDIPPAILIMPGCPSCWWVDGAKDKAETAFWNDVVAGVDRTYRTIASRLGRVIAGVSAGGYGAVRFGLKYPDRVAAVAALSPAVYAVTPPTLSHARRDPPFQRADGQFNQSLWSAENYPRLIEPYFAQHQRVAFYLASGDHDELGIASETFQLHSVLVARQAGQVELNLVEGRHNWSVWGPTMNDAMTFVFSHIPLTPEPLDARHPGLLRAGL